MAHGLKPFAVVPKGTRIDITVTLPHSHGGMRHGLRWIAPIDMPAADVRREIGNDVFTPFLDQLLARKEG